MTATWEGNVIVVKWRTTSESADHDGFDILRAEVNEYFDAGTVPNAIIPANGAPSGKNYEYRDIEVVPGRTYYYWIESYSDASDMADFTSDPIQVDPAQTPTPTASPTASPTLTGTPPTATPTVTGTPPTATPTPTGSTTATPTATNTPPGDSSAQFTVTPTPSPTSTPDFFPTATPPPPIEPTLDPGDGGGDPYPVPEPPLPTTGGSAPLPGGGDVDPFLEDEDPFAGDDGLFVDESGVDPFFEESGDDPAGPGGVFPAAPGAAAGSDQAQPLPTLTPRAVETVAMALNQPLPPAGLPASSGLPAPVPARTSVDTFLMLMSAAFAVLAALAGVGIVWLVVRRPTV